MNIAPVTPRVSALVMALFTETPRRAIEDRRRRIRELRACGLTLKEISRAVDARIGAGAEAPAGSRAPHPTGP